MPKTARMRTGGGDLAVIRPLETYPGH
jgi:hypothetical protein